MHKNRGPSSQNDNERLFMYHDTRRAEKSGGKPDSEIQRLMIVVPLCCALAQEYMQLECVSYGLSVSSGVRISALK